MPCPAASTAARSATRHHAGTWVHLRMGSSVISSVVSSIWLITPQIWYDLPLVLVGTCGGRRGREAAAAWCIPWPQNSCGMPRAVPDLPGSADASHVQDPQSPAPPLHTHLLDGALETAVPGLHGLWLFAVQHAAQVGHLQGCGREAGRRAVGPCCGCRA